MNKLQEDLQEARGSEADDKHSRVKGRRQINSEYEVRRADDYGERSVTEDRHRVWDLGLRFASSAALVIAFLVGLHQYHLEVAAIIV